MNFNPYFPLWCVETSLYKLLDDFNKRHIANREFSNRFLEIHPFLNGNGRTYRLLSINQVKENEKGNEGMSCCLIN